jgi:hypothetical protein
MSHTKIYNAIQSKEVFTQFMTLNPNMSQDQLISVYCMLVTHGKKDYVPLFFHLIKGEGRKLALYREILAADHRHDEIKEHIVVQDAMGHVLTSLPDFDRNVIYDNTRSILVSASIGMDSSEIMADDDVDEIVKLMQDSKPRRQKMEVSDLSERMEDHFNDWAKDFKTSTGIDFTTSALPDDSAMDFDENTDAALIDQKHYEKPKPDSYDMEFERFMEQDDDSDVELPIDI